MYKSDLNQLKSEVSLLLERLEERQGQIEPLDQTQIRNLGVGCHEQMLKCAEQDLVTAIDLALTGERLFRQLKQSAPDQPDWVEIYHEQFCRYGAIWIQEQIRGGGSLNGQIQQYSGLAFLLLERLESFHPDLPPWITMMRQEMQELAQQALQLPRLALVGNCQMHPIYLALRQVLPELEIYFCPSVHLATAVDVAELHAVLPETDFLVMHRIQPGYRDGIGLDGATLQQLLPPHACGLVLPNLHYEGHHPLIGYAHLPEEQGQTLAAESPMGDYHDFLAMVAAERGLTATHVLQLPLQAPMADLLRQWHADSLEQLRRREADCDLAISSWIEQHHRQSPLFHTFNHPCNRLLERVVAAVVEQLEFGQVVSVPDLGSVEQLGRQQHSVLPWVAEALNLDPWASADGQRDWAVPWSLQEQLQTSIDFYRCHPSIGEANRNAKKYQLANQLLELADSIIPYAYLDPLTDYQRVAGADPGLAHHEGPVDGWPLELNCYPIGHRPVVDALVLPVGLIAAGRWICDSIQYLPLHWNDTPWIQSVGGFDLVQGQGHLGLLRRQIFPEVPLSGTWCVLNDFVGHYNFAHFFHDELPQIAAIRQLQAEDPSIRVLVRPSPHPNITLLRRLLLGDTITPRPSGSDGGPALIRLERAHLQPIAINIGNGFFPEFTQAWWLAVAHLRLGLTQLHEVLQPLAPASGFAGHWICLTRDLHATTVAPQGRRFTNYPQLLEALSNAGVILFDPGRHAITDLYPLLRQARGFIGIHGAGLTNAYFGQPGSRVIEIRSFCGNSLSLELLGKALGLDWCSLDTSVSPDDPSQGWIDVDRVLALMAD